MMFSSRRKPSSSNSSSFTSSSDNSYRLATRRPSPVTLRQLSVRNFDDTNSFAQNDIRSEQREPFYIPRPTIAMPYPSVYIPGENYMHMFHQRPTHLRQYPPSPSNLTVRTQLSEGPFYQIALPENSPPIQYQIIPIQSKRPSPIDTRTRRYIKRKKYKREKTPGICATLCSGGFATLAALIYLTFCLALPITKLVLGIIYVKDCPAEKNIPIYMIVSGACGTGLVLFLLLSSSCSYYRSYIVTKKFIHQCMICTVAFARGMQGLIFIFLIVWFFVGNVWVFGAQYRVQTNNPDNSNYCQPVLYWFSFYVLIFTYVYAMFMCSLKFFANFFCCRACDIWKRAFS